MSLPGVSISDQTDNVKIVLDLSGVLGVSHKFDGQWHLSFSKVAADHSNSFTIIVTCESQFRRISGGF